MFSLVLGSLWYAGGRAQLQPGAVQCAGRSAELGVGHADVLTVPCRRSCCVPGLCLPQSGVVQAVVRAVTALRECTEEGFLTRIGRAPVAFSEGGKSIPRAGGK